jgi:hypothetical protein|tara:strand:+ start:332 stop:586 length:255 start_codon:yes stop_codon:yes gene_type:complete
MIQLTLDLQIEHYTPICSCEGCFRDSTHTTYLGRESFDTCEYHYHELMMIDDWDTERIDAQIMMTPLAKALEYREEMFQYNNRQ